MVTSRGCPQTAVMTAKYAGLRSTSAVQTQRGVLMPPRPDASSTSLDAGGAGPAVAALRKRREDIKIVVDMTATV